MSQHQSHRAPHRQSYRRPIPLWQIAPFLLVPPTLVAAVTLLWDLPLAPFLTTLALASFTLLLLVVRSNRKLAPRRAHRRPGQP